MGKSGSYGEGENLVLSEGSPDGILDGHHTENVRGVKF